MITRFLFKGRRRMFSFDYKSSGPTPLAGVLRLAVVLWQLLSWLKLLK